MSFEQTVKQPHTHIDDNNFYLHFGLPWWHTWWRICLQRGRPKSDPSHLEKGNTTHSSILAWRIPRTEEPGRLQPIGLQKNQTQLREEHTHTRPVRWELKGITELCIFARHLQRSNPQKVARHCSSSWKCKLNPPLPPTGKAKITRLIPPNVSNNVQQPES